MFAVFFCMCCAVVVMVCGGKICGCFTQGNGRAGGMGKLVTGLLKFVTSALFIPVRNACNPHHKSIPPGIPETGSDLFGCGS